MIALSDFLEDFAAARSRAPLAEPGVDAKTFEAKRLESFEEGYRAGWDDAARAQSEDSTRLTSALTQQLSDLSFTYQEAFGAATRAVLPLIEDMVNTLLPALARESIGAHLVSQLSEMAEQIGDTPVEIAVAPGRAEAVAPLLEQDFAFPIRVVEDASLAEEQADIRFAEIERQIDLTDTLAGVKAAVEGFAEQSRRKIANG